VLGLVTAEALMAEHPDANEGGLSQARADAVNQRALAARARSLGLQDLIRLGRGARRQGGRSKDSILANAFEAVVGALYLDGGLEAARAFLEPELRAELAEPVGRERDAKSALQEHLQGLGQPPPDYAVVETHGPAHARRFSVEVRAGDTVIGTGHGASKRAAEQAAARAGLIALNTRES